MMTLTTTTDSGFVPASKSQRPASPANKMEGKEMENKPRPFTIGQGELAGLLAGDGWSEGLLRLSFTRDPTWFGYLRQDGTGLALDDPSHLEMLELRSQMIVEAQTQAVLAASV
jgi:hypothetical protein